MTRKQTKAVNISLLQAQYDFISDETSNPLAFIGGLGSGKTFGAACKAIALGIKNPGCTGLFIEPTYPMVRDIAVPAFEEVLEMMGLRYKWIASHYVLRVGGRNSGFKIVFRTGEKPKRIVGINAAWVIIDEPGLMSEEVAKKARARLRGPKIRVKQLCLTGTPEGMNWLYDWLVRTPSPNTKVIYSSTDDNHFAGDGYADDMTSRMSEQEAAQYRHGKFVTLSGAVYHRFNRQDHVVACQNPLEGEIEIWADFNVGKMAWLFARRVSDEWHVFAELIGIDTNTYDQTETAIQFLADAMSQKMRITITKEQAARRISAVRCDASGNSRKTSATDTDVAIMRRAGLRVVVAASNPAVRDRVASVNEALRLRKLFIDPDCEQLIDCLERQGRAKDGTPDKAAGLDHAPDALGYGVYAHNPVRLPSANASSRYM